MLYSPNPQRMRVSLQYDIFFSITDTSNDSIKIRNQKLS